MPKQFINLLGERSTFQTAVERVTDPAVFGRLTVIAHHDSRFVVAEQVAALGITADILLEPERRDSAAAVAAAAAHLAQKDPDAVIVMVAADHVIPDVAAFRQACEHAAPAARDGAIMTLGFVPTHPATGYGYILPGEPLGHPEARRVTRFVEKPDTATAERYLAEGYLWNSGCLCFRASVMLGELAQFQPEIVQAARSAVQGATRDLDFVRLDARAYAQAPRTSIDYAVLERTQRAGVLPVSFSWSDVGSWDALWDIMARDASGNALSGDVEVLDARNTLVHAQGILTAVVGVEDLVVVAQPDAVLVTTRANSGNVKDLVAQLRAHHRAEADQHLRAYRPWGWYQRIDIGGRFQVKRIMVLPGRRLSLQKHHHRAEHWVVVHGTAEVTVEDRTWLVHENEAAYLPIGCVHRLANPGRIPLELIEVQVGSYTGEDDIVRIEDIYGR
jgi:mannose-1-phosphate guanylyltransferase/mannose-6-phosphate isomerase